MAMASSFWEDSDDECDLDLEAVRVLLNALEKRGGHLPVTSLYGYIVSSPREVMLHVGTTHGLVQAFVEDHCDHFVLADDGEVYSRAALEQEVVSVLVETLDRRGNLSAQRLMGCVVNTKTARLYFGTSNPAAITAGVTQLAHERPDQFVVDEDDEISLYTDTEVEALNVLIEVLLRRGPLPPINLTGHVASAPNRDVLKCVGRTADDVLQFAESFPDIFEVADGRVQLKFRRDVLLSKPEWSNRSIIDDLTKAFLLHGSISFDELALCYENDHMNFLLDSSGYVIQDGDVYRLSPDAFLLRPQETAVLDGSPDVSDSSPSFREAQVRDFEQLKAEARQFLRRVLKKNGSMPMKSLVGHLSQASSAVRQAAGGNVEGLTVFCHKNRDLVAVGPATSFREAPVSLVTNGQQALATGPSSAPEDTKRESLHNKACDIVKIAGHCAFAEFLDREEEIHLSSHLFPADIQISFHKLMEGDRLVVDATVDFRPKKCGHSTKWRAMKARLVKKTESSFKRRLSEVQVSEQEGQHKEHLPMHSPAKSLSLSPLSEDGPTTLESSERVRVSDKPIGVTDIASRFNVGDTLNVDATLNDEDKMNLSKWKAVAVRDSSPLHSADDRPVLRDVTCRIHKIVNYFAFAKLPTGEDVFLRNKVLVQVDVKNIASVLKVGVSVVVDAVLNEEQENKDMYTKWKAVKAVIPGFVQRSIPRPSEINTSNDSTTSPDISALARGVAVLDLETDDDSDVSLVGEDGSEEVLLLPVIPVIGNGCGVPLESCDTPITWLAPGHACGGPSATWRVEAFVLDVDTKLNCAIVVTDSGSVSILPLAPPAPGRGELTRGSLVEVVETPDVRSPGSQSYVAQELISAPQPKQVPSVRLGHQLVAKVIAIGNQPNVLLLQTLDGTTIQGRESGLTKVSFGCDEVNHHLVVGDVIRCKLDTVTEGPNAVAKVSDVDVLSWYVSFSALRQKNFLSWSGEMAACVVDIPTTLASLLPASPKCTASAIKRGRGTVVAVWDRLLVISMASVECACAVFSTNAVSHFLCQVGDVVCFHATRDADETSGITWNASEVWRQTDTFRAMVQPAVTSSLPVRDGSSQTDITSHIMGYRKHCGP